MLCIACSANVLCVLENDLAAAASRRQCSHIVHTLLLQGCTIHTLFTHCCCTELIAALQLLEEVQAIFQIYDDDGSGTLDMEEFVHAMEHTGGMGRGLAGHA